MKQENLKNFTLLVGGADIDQTDLTCLHEHAKAFVAVDGGANKLTDKLQPDFIVGDLDSIDPDLHWGNQVDIQKIPDQNSTDFEKSIAFSLTKGLPQPFVCVGFTGGRFDQTLTILHACCRHPDVKFIFTAEQDLISTLPTGTSTYEFSVGERLSLYPLTSCEFGPSDGLLYPLDGLKMEQGHMIGTSNEVTKHQVSIELHKGVCFLISKIKRPLSTLHIQA